jgi:hypothetical protein
MDKLLTRGNSKLDKSIFCWSITPVVSCLNCEQCRNSCYARKAYRQYPSVKKAWDRNLAMAEDGTFEQAIVNQLKTAKQCKVVRIHVSGDFFSSKYIAQWVNIIKQFPEIHFYSYTKVNFLFGEELKNISNLPNGNIILSIAEDGKMNYGNENRVNELKTQGYSVCPVTKNNKIICGKDCNICLTQEKVCFHIH